MRARDERGFALYEMLIVMILSLGVLAATLITFNQLYQTAGDSDTRHDSVELARNALDRQARQLRNLAKRLNNLGVIDTVGSDNLIFQTSDPNRTWVRYCLETTAPASPSRGRLWEAEVATSTVTTAMRSGCPGTGWAKATVVADYVTNERDGLDRPLFTYACTSGTSACTAAPATYDQLLTVSAQTLIDTKPGKGAAEMRVASSVYLRNQNQAPVATFVSTPRSGTPRTVILNASGSSDFEGRTLRYYWFKGTLPAQDLIACDKPAVTLNASNEKLLWGGRLIGEGITLNHSFPAGDGDSGTTQVIGLVACDPGDRYGTDGVPPLSAAHPVAIP